MKLKISSIISFFMFHIIFIYFPYYPVYKKVIIPLLMCLCGLYIFVNFKYIDKKYKDINRILIIFYVFSIITAIFNIKIIASLIYSTKIFEVFLFYEIIESKGMLKNSIRLYTYLFILYTIISDILIFVKPELFNINRAYLIGNKFYLIYHHIITILFIYELKLNKKNVFLKILTFLFLLFSVYLSFYVDCITGAIGIILMIIFLYLSKKNFRNIILNEKSIIFILLFSCSVLFLFSNILNNRIVINFIESLNGDPTLTGRTRIYNSVASILINKLFLGYGYGNSYNIMYDSIKAPNTQNGLLQLVLYFGIIGGGLIVLLIYKVCKNSRKRSFLMLYILIFSILAVVEITIDIKFMGILALLNGLGQINENQEVFI